MPKIELIQGDCLEKMKDIPDGSIDMVFTSPPYNMNLRIRNGKHCSRQIVKELSVEINGDVACSSPYIVNFSIEGISSDALLNQLATTVALSSGSACSSGAIDPSYVLRAMGVEGDALYGAVRASFSRYHTMTDISQAVERIVAAVRRMQELD